MLNWKNQSKDDISIDGNNRTITIDNYLNDKVKIKNGDYTLSDGRVVVIDDSNNTWYSHPEEFREDILETFIFSIKLEPYQDILIVQDKI